MSTANNERAEFEAWIRTQPGYTDAVLGRRDSPGSARVGEYVSQSVEFSWRAWQVRAAKAPAAEPGRWYAMTSDGIATLCADREDAVKMAASYSNLWPKSGPYRAVQLYTAPPAPTEQWISVEDRLPNPHKEVLLAIEGGHVTTGSYMPSLQCFYWEPCDDAAEYSAVTHWMPKPTPPQGAAKGAT